MSGICPRCARRDWLFSKLGMRLDFRAYDLPRLWPLLELPDAELIEALGGRRRAELHSAYAEWEPEPTRAKGNVQSICRHHVAYPARLRDDALAPHTLNVLGGIERLNKILNETVVAIVGTRRASDYGIETARGLARSLAASGLTIVGGFADGIAAAAHCGALDVDGSTLTVTARGVERCSPASRRELYHRITERGCAISETQATSGSGRRWRQAGCDRMLALLAQLVIVVEADENPWELACAHLARTRGVRVAAVPGRVSSPASRGPNAMLMEGARLVRGPQDALDLLHGAGTHAHDEPPGRPIDLQPHLLAVLERVGDGADTLAKLTAQGCRSADAALALAELELQGLLVRGDAGRYLPSAGVLAA